MSTERRWLKIRDYLTIRPTETPELQEYLKNKDSKPGSSLLLRVAATHSGIITGNRKFYRPDFMRDSVGSWTPKNKPALPVLKGHDEEGAVLGRVREAKYIDESWKWVKDYPQLKDGYFLNQDSAKRGSLFKSIDFITGTLCKNPDFQGLGHIELGLELTNPDAIEKVLREEYLCVSAGAVTDEAICSICHTDWASNDKCEHRPGEIVDGKKMFLISGRFRYEELSFVNFPADPFAAVKTKELKDSLERMFFLGLGVDAQELAIGRGLRITDSLYESDIQISYEEPVMTIDFDALEKEVKSSNLTSQTAFELKDRLQALIPENDEDKGKIRSLKSTLTAKIRRNAWSPESVAVIDTVLTEEMQTVTVVADSEISTVIAEANSALECENDVCSWEGFTLTDEDQAFFADEEKVYDQLIAEMDLAVTEGELLDSVVKDAKLSTEARKKLKGGSFCGPGRSFPVNDCAHYTAALRLLNRASVSDETKSKIRACVERKGKSMSCTTGSKDAVVEVVSEVNQISDDIQALAGKNGLQSKNGDAASHPTDVEDCLACYDKLDKHHGKADDELKSKIHGLHNAIGERWGAERWEGYARETVAKHNKDSVFISKDELALKEDTILELTEEVKGLKDTISTKNGAVATFFKDSKESLATAIVMNKVLRGCEGYTGLSAEKVQDKIKEYASRRIESLKDAITDIFDELQWGVQVTVEPIVKSVDSATTVNDNARVDETVVLNPEDKTPEVENPQTDLRDRIAIQSALRYISSPAERSRVAAMLDYNG